MECETDAPTVLQKHTGGPPKPSGGNSGARKFYHEDMMLEGVPRGHSGVRKLTSVKGK